jgi:cytochrome c553
MNEERGVNRYAVTLSMMLGMTGLTLAADPVPHEEGIEGRDYVWNEMQGEKLQALRAKGDPQRGEITFEVCQGCHRAGALGRVDGSYPRLAGQHDTVLIKQLTDVRAGRRDNPKMLPFADKHVLSPQDIADIATFLQRLPVPPNNGKGAGENLERARKLYEADCADCHGKNGEGISDKFYPRVSGQHYKYLLRESFAIRDGERRNANPKMVRIIKGYDAADVTIVSDYMSRLVP